MKGFASSKMYDFTITRYGIWNSEGAGGGRTSLAFEYGVMAYCIALGDLVAHGLGRRNRIFGIWDLGFRMLEIVGRWEAIMQRVYVLFFSSAIDSVKRKSPFFWCLRADGVTTFA